MKYLTLLIGLCLVTTSCFFSKENDLSRFMIGDWETSYIKIDMPTVNKSDSLSIFEDDFSAPNSGKAQSSYLPDGTFKAWFKKTDGTRVDETDGLWHVKDDSLFVKYDYRGKQVNARYLIKRHADGFDGTVIYDWDNDGEHDDTLFMKTKRISAHEAQ